MVKYKDYIPEQGKHDLYTPADFADIIVFCPLFH